MAVATKSSDVSPPSEMGDLSRRVVLLGKSKLTRELKDGELVLDARSQQLLLEVEQILSKLIDIRFKHPESHEFIMKLENKIFHDFPEADPDR